MAVSVVLALVLIIKRRSVAAVGSTALHKVRRTDFVFLPRLRGVMKRKRVSNVFITLEKERKAKLISTI